MAGAGAEARNIGREGIEEQNLEDQEPRWAGIPNGGAIGETGGLSVWDVVSEIEIAVGTRAGNGGDRPCYSACSVSDVEVQSGIRPVERERISEAVR